MSETIFRQDGEIHVFRSNFAKFRGSMTRFTRSILFDVYKLLMNDRLAFSYHIVYMRLIDKACHLVNEMTGV